MLAAAGAALPKLTRCLAQLLRTCVHPPSLLLRVEHVFGKALAGSHRNAVDRYDDEEEPHGQDQIPTPGDDHGNDSAQGPDSWCFRCALSDGHLQIQAVLAPALLRAIKELWELQRGDLIEVYRFQVRSAPRVSGKGRVVYLGIQDCEWVGQDRETGEQQPEERDQLELEGGFLREGQDEMFSRKRDLTDGPDRNRSKRRGSGDRDKKAHTSKKAPSQLKSSKPAQKPSRNASEADSDDEEGFDTILVSQSQLELRRETLRQIQQQPSFEEATVSRLELHGEYAQAETQVSFAATSFPLTSNHSFRDAAIDNGARATGEASVADHHDALLHQQPTDFAVSTIHSAPLGPRGDHSVRPSSTTSISPVDSLSSLLALPNPKSYTCSVLGLISWVSPSLIHRPNTPFPPKRHIKIHDPSISHRTSGVTVAIFVDAQKFLPAVGTVALFRGLVMHRVRGGYAEQEGDVILNKYPSKTSSQKAENEGEALGEAQGDGERESEWFIADETRLVQMGFDVHGIKTWWAQRAAARKGKGTRISGESKQGCDD